MSSKSERDFGSRGHAGEKLGGVPGGEGKETRAGNAQARPQTVFSSTFAQGLVPSHLSPEAHEPAPPLQRAIPEPVPVKILFDGQERQEPNPEPVANHTDTRRVTVRERVSEREDQSPKPQDTDRTDRKPELQYVELDRGVVLPYLESGTPDDNEDTPSHLGLVGIGAGAESLWHLAQEMDEHVIIFEAPIAGLPLAPSLRWYANATAKAAKEVTGKDKFKVTGHSWGGLLGQEMAHLEDIDIQRLGILASIAVRPHTSLRDYRAIIRALTNKELWDASLAISKPNRTGVDPGVIYGDIIPHDFVEQFGHLIHREINMMRHMKQLGAVMGGVVPLAYNNWVQRGAGHGPRTIVVIGRRDRVIPFEYTSLQAEALGLTVYPVENAGHLLPILKKEEVAHVLREFDTSHEDMITPYWQPPNPFN